MPRGTVQAAGVFGATVPASRVAGACLYDLAYCTVLACTPNLVHSN